MIFFELKYLIFQAVNLIFHHFQLDLGVLILGRVTVAVGRRREGASVLIGSAGSKGIHFDLPDELLRLLVMLILPQSFFNVGQDLCD